MLILFQSTTGGRDWSDQYDVLSKIGVMPKFFYILYIFFFTFAFINIVISIFMDKAMKLAQPDMEALMLQKRREQMRVALEMKEFLQRRCAGDDVTYDELAQALEDPEMLEFLEQADLSSTDLLAFYALMAASADSDPLTSKHSLGIDVFAAGCLKMK